MPMVIILPSKDKTYLFADNNDYNPFTTTEKTSKRSFSIQKFKNFVIAHNDEKMFAELVEKVDFDSFPEPLTKGDLIRGFYSIFIDHLVDDSSSDVKDEYLEDSDFSLFIMGKDYAFVINSDYICSLSKIEGLGDYEIAVPIYKVLKDKTSDEELIKIMMKKSAEFCGSVDFPFIMVTSDDLDTLKIVDENLNIKDVPFDQVWRKKNA